MTTNTPSKPASPDGSDPTRLPPGPDGRTAPQDGGDVEGDMSMPHERDQSSHMTDGVPDSKVRQAGEDVERGLQDTSKATEMDRTYHKQR